MNSELIFRATPKSICGPLV